MSSHEEFQPPVGPPPPRVPEGWKAVWNIQYNEWFYVNLNTKLSQWEAPEGAAPPRGPPPSFIDTEEEHYCDGNGSADHPAPCGAKSPHKSHRFRKLVRKWVDKLPGKGGSHHSTSGCS